MDLERFLSAIDAERARRGNKPITKENPTTDFHAALVLGLFLVLFTLKLRRLGVSRPSSEQLTTDLRNLVEVLRPGITDNSTFAPVANMLRGDLNDFFTSYGV